MPTIVKFPLFLELLLSLDPFPLFLPLGPPQLLPSPYLLLFLGFRLSLLDKNVVNFLMILSGFEGNVFDFL